MLVLKVDITNVGLVVFSISGFFVNKIAKGRKLVIETKEIIETTWLYNSEKKSNLIETKKFQ